MSDDTAITFRTRGPVPSNVDLAAQALREEIVSGRLAPGERIKEIPIAEALGISRGPIREAIRQLEHDGLLNVIRNRGAVVEQPTAEDVLEVYAMRASLGALALHKLMLGTSPPLATLECHVEQIERAAHEGRAAKAAEADLAYQTAIVSSAGLRRVARHFDQTTWQVRIFIAVMQIRYDDKLVQMAEEVRSLHTAIAEGETQRAEALWREKFERWSRDFIDQMPADFDRELWVALTAGPLQRS
jgi:DNA-binding GntR family transcriptional regulator